MDRLMPESHQSSDLLPNSGQNLHSVSLAVKGQPMQAQPDKSAVFRSRINRQDAKLQVYKDLQSNAEPSKYQTLMELAQKLVKSITMQLNGHPPTGQSTSTIKISQLMLLRLQGLNKVIAKIKHQQSYQQNGTLSSNAHNNSQTNQRSPNSLGLEQKIKRQLSHLVEQAFGRKYQSLTIDELLGQTNSIVSELKKAKISIAKLQSENKKVRLYYLQQIENYKEELKFIQEVIQQKQLQVDALEKEICTIRKARPLFGDQELYSIDVNEPPTGFGSEKIKKSGSFNIYNSFCSPRQASIEIEVDQIQMHTEQAEEKSNKIAVSNPQSHQKSKSDMVWREVEKEHESIDEEMALYSQLGSVNARMKELNNLLNQRLLRSEQELTQKSQQLSALNQEVYLLEENISYLNERIEMRQGDCCASENRFLQLQQEITMKEMELASIQEQINALTDERVIEEYNLQKVQEQLQFLQEQCELVSKQVSELRRQA